jgi:hypothetical protein
MLKPIYIYIEKTTSLFTSTNYFIVYDLIDLTKFAIYESNCGTFQMNFQPQICNDYLNGPELFDFKRKFNCFNLITFKQLLELIDIINKEGDFDSVVIVELLHLVVAKWEEWY